MSVKFDQIITAVEGADATVRLKSGAPGTLEGKVSVEDQESLLFSMVAEPEGGLPEKAFADFTILSPRGVVRGNGLVVQRSPRHLHLRPSGNVTLIQRREHFRFPVDAAVILTPPWGVEELATLRDISLSGGRIETGQQLLKGQKVAVRLEQAPVGNLTLDAIVRAIHPSDPKKQQYGLEWTLTTQVWELLKQVLVAVLQKRWPAAGYVPTPRTPEEIAAEQDPRESPLVKRAENARGLLEQIVELLLKGQANPDYTHEVIRLSTALIQEVAAIGQDVKKAK